MIYFLGVGKSDVIKVLSMHAEFYLRKFGEASNLPRVLVTAHTGKAASLIGELFNLLVFSIFLSMYSAHCENLTNFFHFLGPEFLQPEMTFENHRFAKLNETIES